MTVTTPTTLHADDYVFAQSGGDGTGAIFSERNHGDEIFFFPAIVKHESESGMMFDVQFVGKGMAKAIRSTHISDLRIKTTKKDG